MQNRPSSPLSPEYWGVGGSGAPRVYAYLKNFLALEGLLGALGETGCEAVVVCDGVPAEVRGKFRGARGLRFVDEPLDLGREALAGRFDLAVLNAGHGTTAAMLLAGVPALLVPIHLEQGMLARAAERNTGACAQGDHKDAAQLVARLREVLEPRNLQRYRDAARAFAQKYGALDAREPVRRMVRRLEELLESGRRGDTAIPRHGDGAAVRGKVFAG
jgi:hypothetical protein